LRAGPLTISSALAIAAQIAEALARVHEAGVVHRDLKPENVMVAGDGLVKVLDFRLAKATPLAPAGAADSTLDVETSVGAGRGTGGCRAPGRASGGAAAFHADQFALGTILYEMLSGRRAFQRATAVETLSAIIREAPPPLGDLRPEAPEDLRVLVERC